MPVYCMNCGGVMIDRRCMIYCSSCFHVDFFHYWNTLLKRGWKVNQGSEGHPSLTGNVERAMSQLPKDSAYYK